MRRIPARSFYMVVAVMMFLFHQAAMGCAVDEFYLTNVGHLAGSTQDNLSKAEKTDPQHLTAMIDKGEVIRLQDDIKIQALERSVEQQMIKIKFLDRDNSFWVREDALKRIKSN